MNTVAYRNLLGLEVAVPLNPYFSLRSRNQRPGNLLDRTADPAPARTPTSSAVCLRAKSSNGSLFRDQLLGFIFHARLRLLFAPSRFAKLVIRDYQHRPKFSTIFSKRHVIIKVAVRPSRQVACRRRHVAVRNGEESVGGRHIR